MAYELQDLSLPARIFSSGCDIFGCSFKIAVNGWLKFAWTILATYCGCKDCICFLANTHTHTHTHTHTEWRRKQNNGRHYKSFDNYSSYATKSYLHCKLHRHCLNGFPEVYCRVGCQVSCFLGFICWINFTRFDKYASHVFLCGRGENFDWGSV